MISNTWVREGSCSKGIASARLAGPLSETLSLQYIKMRAGLHSMVAHLPSICKVQFHLPQKGKKRMEKGREGGREENREQEGEGMKGKRTRKECMWIPCSSQHWQL